MSNFVNIIYGIPNSGYSRKLAELVAHHLISGKSVLYFTLDQGLKIATERVQKALDSIHLINPERNPFTPYPIIIKQLPRKAVSLEDLHAFCNEYGYRPDILAIDHATLLKFDNYDKEYILQQLYSFANQRDYEIISYMQLGRMASV